MSQIKKTLETDLQSFWTETEINWRGVSFDPSNQDEFISPSFIPIDDNREVFSSLTPYKEMSFFNITIHLRKNQGTGRLYDLYDILLDRYREKTFGQVTCDSMSPNPLYEDGDYNILPFRIRAHIFKS